MEYALTILVFAVFFVAYLLVKKKPKEEALPTLNEEEYLKEVKSTVFRMQAPDKNCQINDKQYKRRVKWLRFVLKSKKYKGIFEDFFGDKAIVDQICKIDFSPLSLDEKAALSERIENISFNGLHWKQGFQSAIFFVEEDFDISCLNVPAGCRLSRLQ